MKLVRTRDELSRIITSWRAEGKTIGLVPTMGWFHQGHLSLMSLARRKADKVVVSLFINPIQFAEGEDLSTYPHDLARDMKLAEGEGVDLLFAPAAEDMYPGEFQTAISVKKLTKGLCGASRPGHFDGVATVVAKLFNMVQPHLAIFGEKDYQQLAVIRQMVRDLNFNVEIFGHPIVREADGLAMSSRNSYLSDEERRNALCLHTSILRARELVANSSSRLSVRQLTDEVAQIITTAPGCTVDYIAVVDKDSLLPLEIVEKNSLLALAVKMNNRVRLIDNSLLSPDS
jgi:pantoate--beta-alanine ligase